MSRFESFARRGMNNLFGAFGEVLLPILFVAGLGYTLRRSIKLDLPTVNRVSIYVLSPCLIFNALLHADVGGAETMRMLTFGTLSILAMGVIALFFSGILRLERTDQSAFLLSTMFMNAGNYGLPLARFAFGEDGFHYAVIFYLAQAILAQTLAVFIAAYGQASIRGALLKVIRLPLIYAVVGALLLRGLLGVPGPGTPALLLSLDTGVELIANAALPMLLLLLGMQLAEAQPIINVRRVALASVLRLVVAAPLAYLMVRMLGLGGLAASVGILQASMPTAVNMSILSLEFDTQPQFVNSVVIVTTFGSLLSLTVLLTLMR